MEDTTRQDYVAYQRERGHPNLTISKAGLVVSLDNPWLAASPDDRVTDPDDRVTDPDMSTFCLQKKETNTNRPFSADVTSCSLITFLHPAFACG